MIKKKLLATLSIAATLLLCQNITSAKPILVGEPLPKEDFVVVGVPMGARLSEIKQSLGEPTAEGKSSLVYGGLTFSVFGPNTDDSPISSITITNRDATTARGIAVGDSLKKVEAAYGKPVDTQNKSWFYGYFYKRSGNIVGIYFEHDGKKVKRIKYIAA